MPGHSTTRHGSLYGSEAWRRASKRFLGGHPLCPCGAPADVTDHIRPHKGDARLFWDIRNWQAMCWGCHSRKTRADEAAARSGRPARPRLAPGCDAQGMPLDKRHLWRRT